MSGQSFQQFVEGSSDELDVLLEVSVSHALDLADGYTFVQWFPEIVPLLAPRLAAAFGGSGVEQRSALTLLGRLLWNRIPHPDHRFRPRPLPKPERNGPCPCGSGRKYKQCCAHAESLGDPFEHLSLLSYVLRRFPRAQLKTLPLDGIDLEELAYVAGQWRNESKRDAQSAVVLLERVLADPDRLDARAEQAFDVLADCYDVLDRPRKKADLIERYLAARDVTLRSTALHRKIAMLADRGERAEAWRLFAAAQRMEPDNPSLAALELSMHLDDGNHERLRERGRFWLARLARDRDHDYSDLIEHIRDLVSDPEGATLKLASRDAPGLLDLRRALATLPALECRYTLNRGDGEVQLVASDRLVELAAEWRHHAEVDKPDLVMLQSGDSTAPSRVAPGIAWLARHPEAWQSFEILDDLTLAVREARLMNGGAILLEPLLERACALLRLALERNAAADCRLPWVFLGNRPALRLAASLCYLRLDQRRFDDAETIARWLVLDLNPNDNHGLRAELTRLALRRGDARAALDVCDRYPDDAMIDIAFNRVLARFMLGRRDEAASALRDAAKSHPKILPMLLAPSRKRPRDSGPYVTYGSAQEAWIYRDESRALWEQTGALDWAREAARPRALR